MGFLDDIKNKASGLGGKAGDAFDTAKHKAGDIFDDVRHKLDANKDGEHSVNEVVEAAKARLSAVLDELKEKASRGGDSSADRGTGAAGAEGADAAAAARAAESATTGTTGTTGTTDSPPVSSVESTSMPGAGPPAEPLPGQATSDAGVAAPDLIGSEDVDTSPSQAGDPTGPSDSTGLSDSTGFADSTDSAVAAKDDALGAVQGAAEDLKTDS